MTTLNRSSKNRLTESLLPQFSGDTLFDAVARAVCKAGCLPRKELYESWEVARRVRRRFRGGRIVGLACGHGLLAMILLLPDDRSPEALAVDRCIPESAKALYESLAEAWPRLNGRVKFLETELEEVQLLDDDIIVSAHACGTLLQLDGLVERVRSYVQLRGTAIIPKPPGSGDLRPESARMLQEILLRGEAPRGAVVEASGLKERTGRNVLGQLISEGLLVSDTPKEEVRIGFPNHAIGLFFPEMYPVLR